MSTEVTTIDPDMEAYLAAKTAAAKTSGPLGIPKLTVNRTPVNDEGTPLPMGNYCVTIQDPETEELSTIFAETVVFHPVEHRYQYNKYNEDTEKFEGKSVYFQSFFGGEIKDSMGTMRCGKVTAKGVTDATKSGLWTPAKEKENKRAKCSHNIWGFVTISGINEAKEAVQLDALPCVIRTGGSNWNAIGDVLDELKAGKADINTRNWLMSNHMEKKGSNVFYPFDILIDYKTIKTINAEQFGTIKNVFLAEIDDTNKYVLGEWQSKQTEVIAAADEMKAVIDMTQAPLSKDDFADEIPF